MRRGRGEERRGEWRGWERKKWEERLNYGIFSSSVCVCVCDIRSICVQHEKYESVSSDGVGVCICEGTGTIPVG